MHSCQQNIIVGHCRSIYLIVFTMRLVDLAGLLIANAEHTSFINCKTILVDGVSLKALSKLTIIPVWV
jgi:hypothetical protein